MQNQELVIPFVSLADDPINQVIFIPVSYSFSVYFDLDLMKLPSVPLIRPYGATPSAGTKGFLNADPLACSAVVSPT